MNGLLDRFPGGVYDLSKIEASKVVFVGFGSVNAKIAASLAPLPLRKYVFIDPKPLKRNNLLRHILGKSEIGKPKVEGGVRWMVEHGVARSRIYAYQARSSDVLRFHTDADLVICGVDKKAVKKEVSDWCALHGIPLIISSVFAQGVGGQIIVLPKPQDVCFTCAQAGLGLLDYTGVAEGTDYGVDPSILQSASGDAMAVPSLGAPVGAIADLTAIEALQIIGKGGEVPSHVLKVVFEDWVEMLNIPERSLHLGRIAGFMDSMPELHMLPVWKLDKQPRTFTLSMRMSMFPHAIDRWADCPSHSAETVSASDI